MKGSANGNTNSGLSGGETAGLVVGILGLILTALTVFKGWRSKTDQTNSTVINNIHYRPPAPSHPSHDIPVSPAQDIPLQPTAPQPHPPLTPLQLKPLVPSHPEESHARTPTVRVFTWPDAMTPAN